MESKRYQLEETLGQGRLSTVYRAQDLQTGRAVALKVLQPHLRAQASIVQRFKREMAAVQRLDHEAIIRIFELVETPEHLTLVMEFAPGVDLKTWVQTHGAMAPGRIIKIAQTLLDALAQAHARGILHRDLNLSNIILDAQNNDRIEIIGFGLARVDELVGLTMHTRVLGTLETMAPEAVLGKTIDAQADLFSIGAMLFELVTARPLHDGRMSSGLAFATRDDYLESVRASLKIALKDDAPDLLRTVLRALAPDPTLRFATARQMHDALRGNYDEATWDALETTPTKSCDHCQRPWLEGANACVYCGHTPAHLIQAPGADAYRVEITRSPEVDARDAQEMPAHQLRALYEVLFQYEDTQRAFQADPADLTPPFVLFDQLSHDDAKRVGKLLATKQIPNIITHPSDRPPTPPNKKTRNNKTPPKPKLFSFGEGGEASLAEHLKVFSIPVVLLLLPSFIVLFSGGPEKSFICLAISAVPIAIWGVAFFGLAAIFQRRKVRKPTPLTLGAQKPARAKSSSTSLRSWLHFNLAQRRERSLKTRWLLLTLASFIALFSWLFAQQILGLNALGILILTGLLTFTPGWMLAKSYKKQYQKLFAPTQTEPKSTAIIPGALLENHRAQSIQNVLPRGALHTLQKLKPPALQQDFHDILELSARLFQDTRVPALALHDALAPLFLHTNTLLNQLAELVKNTPESSAETILKSLALLEGKLARASKTKDVEALISQKTSYLDELDTLDDIAQQTSIVRNQLLDVRATILDLQSQFGRDELPSMEEVKEEITELQIRVEAKREVHELLENA